ncbi:MAG: S41 family peptidase [Pseudomonadota bacterium]
MKTRATLLLLVGALLGGSVALAPAGFAERGDGTQAQRALPWEQARLLAEVLERVQRDFVDDVDEAQLIEGAIRGLVSELDPHSAFLDAEQYREIRISTTGSYSGVGLEVNEVDGHIVVVTPMEGTPAEAAGIQPGDELTAIDGESVVGVGLSDTVMLMRGNPGSEVVLDFERGEGEGEREHLTRALRRTNIAVASVRSQLLEPGFGYLRISQFSATTARDTNRALAKLSQTNEGPLNGLVLDLRNNPGGVLEAAADVADAFLESGLIVSADGRVPEARFSMNAHPGDQLDGAPIVVLVNGGTASASEIVAGALKDHERGVVIGKQTYGKGSVQTVMPLSAGRAIKLTTSLYYTPSGASIHERGIEPDIVVSAQGSRPLTPTSDVLDDTVRDGDQVLQKGLIHLKGLSRQRASVVATRTETS